MEHVSSKKLEAIASFIVNNEVNGNCACCAVLDSMPEEMQKEVNAPCKSPNYDDDEWCYDCPFYSKEAFLYWIKPDKKLSIKEVKRPKERDFSLFLDTKGKSLVDYKKYAEALEKYCMDLENLFANLEYDLDNAECENRELQDVLEKIRGVLDGKY